MHIRKRLDISKYIACYFDKQFLCHLDNIKHSEMIKNKKYYLLCLIIWFAVVGETGGHYVGQPAQT